MKHRVCLLLSIFSLSSAALGQDQNACPSGTYALVTSPDGSTLSILFDGFILNAGGVDGPTVDRKVCNLQIPLTLPANQSLGVYKVDYRGYAKLGKRQYSDLSVTYALGPHNKGRNFRRRVKGDFDGDFLFSETLGAGAMKRVGCGETASIDVTMTLDLRSGDQPDPAMASLDSADGSTRGGLVYHLDYKKCST